MYSKAYQSLIICLLIFSPLRTTYPSNLQYLS
nr:MAG TPA: hypothetical protein [Bacteriophage sp.]